MQFLKDNDDMRKALKKVKEKLNLPGTVTNFPDMAQEAKADLVKSKTTIIRRHVL